MRYVIILLISICFLIFAFSVSINILNVVYFQRSQHGLNEIIPDILILLFMSAIYPAICGTILALGKVGDNLREWLDKKKESK